tara:strand:+ start:577 stop:783 length:207 start_codon:yes stop_codon:yes gene_type:complete
MTPPLLKENRKDPTGRVGEYSAWFKDVLVDACGTVTEGDGAAVVLEAKDLVLTTERSPSGSGRKLEGL